MKKVLQAWITDNAVTTNNKRDKILLLQSAGSTDLDDIVDEMLSEDTGLRKETLRLGKSPRSVSARIWVGGAPSDADSDDDGTETM